MLFYLFVKKVKTTQQHCR